MAIAYMDLTTKGVENDPVYSERYPLACLIERPGSWEAMSYPTHAPHVVGTFWYNSLGYFGKYVKVDTEAFLDEQGQLCRKVSGGILKQSKLYTSASMHRFAATVLWDSDKKQGPISRAQFDSWADKFLGIRLRTKEETMTCCVDIPIFRPDWGVALKVVDIMRPPNIEEVLEHHDDGVFDGVFSKSCFCVVFDDGFFTRHPAANFWAYERERYEKLEILALLN